MSSIHIRDINEKTLASLKRLAKQHHRSLQGELHYILENASKLDIEPDFYEELDLVTVSSQTGSNWSREDIYDDNGR